MASIDHLVLTAANDTQAGGYIAQLEAREADGALGHVRSWQVIADPGGRRVGSGGSTLYVLYELARKLRKTRPDAKALDELFAGQRVVIIHSGGDSRRLVPYNAQGKVFTPLPCDMPADLFADGLSAAERPPATLFDLILASLLTLPAPAGGQVLTASGDVLVTLDPDELDFDRPGITGVAYAGPVERGSRHGVYVTEPLGQRGEIASGKVVDFLQKPDETAARKRHAVDSVGRVLVDTGLVSIDPATAAQWLHMAGVRMSRARRSRPKLIRGLLKDMTEGRSNAIDLYEHMLMAAPSKATRRRYLDAMQPSTAGQRNQLSALFETLHRAPFHACVLNHCEFFHIGSNRELLHNVSTLGRTAQLHGFAHGHHAIIDDNASLEGAFVFNALLRGRRIAGKGSSYIEACHTKQAIELSGRNILVGVPPTLGRDIVLPEGVGLVCLPAWGQSRKNHWTVVVHGIDDDCKTSRAEGGTFLNQPLDELLTRHELDASAIWDEPDAAKQTLWNARLWPTGPIDRVFDLTAGLLNGSNDGRWRKGWLGRTRLSFEQLLKRVTHERLIAQRREIQRLVDNERLGERLMANAWLSADEVVASLGSADEGRRAMRTVLALLDETDEPLLRARLHRLNEVVARRWPSVSVQSFALRSGQRASAAVAEAVAQHVETPDEPRPASILHDQVVWVTIPVRLDFAGGWSDTPPICTELGGSVVNAAVTLNGQYPVQVMAKLSEQRRIAVSSIDLGRRVEFRETKDVLAYRDPTDWSALPKAALVLAGICPNTADASLQRWLDALGGGLDLTVFSALPKGSGLGTSSVLGAATLACLAKVTGEAVTHEQLIQRTSLLEQMMTTAGGWQDQVGGILPGVKFIRTQPGPEQSPALQWIDFASDSHAELLDRCVLYYTGIRRMAKNILQQVVSRYLAREPAMRSIVQELKASATIMKADLDRRDFDGFAAGVQRYWELKKRIDPGATNPRIEQVVRRVDPLLSARLLPGAGGGGFLFMIARDIDAARQVRQKLQSRPANEHARLFDFAIDRVGLNVTVL